MQLLQGVVIVRKESIVWYRAIGGNPLRGNSVRWGFHLFTYYIWTVSRYIALAGHELTENSLPLLPQWWN